MKKCNCCNKLKQREDFHKHKNRPDGLQVYCKECKSLKSSLKFKSDPQLLQRQNQSNKKNKSANRDYIRNYKVEKGCAICGENHPAVLDLHHLDPSIKDKAVSQMFHNSREKIEAEILKCIVLCSNCHRKHHYGDEKYAILESYR